MNKRALGVLLVVPLLAMLLVVPFSTQATIGNEYFMRVECGSNGTQFAFADLVFLGHYLLVICSGPSEHQVSTFFESVASGVFVAKLLAGTHYRTDYGTANPSTGCIGGEVLGPGGHSFASWEIDSSACG